MEVRDPTALATLASVVTDWVIRILLAAFPALILTFSLSSVAQHPLGGTFGALVSGYLILGLLAPKLLMRMMRAAGRSASRPYKAYIGPKIIPPVDAFIVGTGRAIETLVLMVWKLGLWLVGLGLLLGIGAALIWGVTKFPVSLAVIVGALVIAGAVSATRR